MALRLLLTLTLWAGRSSCRGREDLPAAPAQPRVHCQAFRYPLAVDCSWTLPPAADSTGPTSFIATYRLGVAAHGESQPCLQQKPEATSCSIPDIQMFSMVPYMLNVTAVHPGGVSSSFVPFVPEHIIKPDPPEEVGPIEATSFTLRAVRPRARYHIQVAAQDLTDYGELSDWSLPATVSVTLGK
ncbi:Interleukin-27 subunit beta [Pteropus alecto]|uniref:Interleukin-27 subunit beta n=1 Tax=Pteropus alecto TaxID=9402 RepID=L5L829_PTEAL|nr:Interleukin-27 subunit beta [Pteropus alecto]